MRFRRSKTLDETLAKEAVLKAEYKKALERLKAADEERREAKNDERDAYYRLAKHRKNRENILQKEIANA